MFKSSFELAEKHLDKSPYLSLWSNPLTLAELHSDDRGRPSFLLHDGPPYANGNLHLGHFVNKSLKDALLKYKRLEGYFAPFVPGFDCHGLPVELEVEKQGVSKEDPVAFVAACRRYATSQVELQKAEFKSFGVAADWDNAYLTLYPKFEAGAARYFSKLPQRVQRLRPVHWCADCGSSLAEAEVDYKSKSSDSLEVLFALLDHNGEHDGKTYLQVWTTTPYTLPANKAVGFHPGFAYGVFETEDGRRLVRLVKEGEVANTVSLAGRQAVSPWSKNTVPLLEADYVTAVGTGLVHLAPAFGMDDFRVCELHQVSFEAVLDTRGKFLKSEAYGELQGLSYLAAGKLVLEKLSTEGLVHSLSTVQHEYPHCWRHKKPLFFRTSEEWFLDLSKVGSQAMDSLEQVTFTPATGKERLSSMLKTRTSWCLSRTRLWGTPLCEKEGDAELLKQVASVGLDAWHSGGARRTLDVWFDSGVTHELVMKERFGRTADLYLEGSDQHRGWFQSSLLTSVALTGQAPYKEVVTHGFVVDEKGAKYSKSSGNYQPMEKLLEQYSPDVLRLWALSQDYTADLKMSKESMARTMERYRKLRNTVRFCLQNLADYDGSGRLGNYAGHAHLRFEMARVLNETREATSTHNFAAAVTSLAQFCESVSSDYFTSLKDVLYCDAADSLARREAQAALAELLNFLLHLLMPVLPFTAEEAFQAAKKLEGLRGYSQDCSLLLTYEGLQLSEGYEVFGANLKELKKEVNRYVEANRDEFLKGPAQLELSVTLKRPVEVSALTDFFGCALVEVEEGAVDAVSVRRTLKPLCPRCRRHMDLTGEGVCVRCDDVEQKCKGPTE